MRYASIRTMDISNGEGIGVSLFTQGCNFHCYNCFNPNTWDFNGGKEWNSDTQEYFLSLIDKPHIKRVSILGGEPLASENLPELLNLINEIRLSFPDKTIWLYSGYTWEQLFEDNEFDISGGICENQIRRTIIMSCNVFIDGRYEDAKRDITLKYRGSSNQRVIDVKRSLKEEKIILYCN